MKRVTQALKHFLKERHDGASPLLVAVSGGGDSLTLLHGLLETPYRAFLHVVHVDHGWREGSAEEAKSLEGLAKELAIPIHMRRVEKVLSEDGARQQRLSFFKQVLGETRAQAVLLGHHSGDLAETTFKRFVEGAPLPKLAGIRPVSVVEGVTLWRPLLSFEKSELFMAPLVQDETNDDPIFHRGLLRTQVFPYLEKALQRPLTSSLTSLASQATLLNDYLEAEATPYLAQVCAGPLGRYLNLPHLPHPYLLSHIVRRFCDKVALSRESVECAVSLLLSGAANRQVQDLHIDRGRLFLFKPPGLLPTKPLSLGSQICGPWRVTLSPYLGGEASGWEALWRGEAICHLPAGDYQVAPFSGDARFIKLLTAQKVPAFLRPHLPVILQNGQMVGQWGGAQASKDPVLSLSLSPISLSPNL